MSKTIKQFKGKHAFLSNFYPVPVTFEGVRYPSSENAYQAEKSGNPARRISFVAISPAHSKKLAKRIPKRPDWHAVKQDIMLQIVGAKFQQNPKLAHMLLNTGDGRLEEGNFHGDRYWGVCPPGSGDGQNNLGIILMEVRSTLLSRHAQPQQGD